MVFKVFTWTWFAVLALGAVTLAVNPPPRATLTGTPLDAFSPAEQEQIRARIMENLRGFDAGKAIRESQQRLDDATNNAWALERRLEEIQERNNERRLTRPTP